MAILRKSDIFQDTVSMIYYKELKKPVAIHLIAGIVLSTVIIFVIVLAKYEKTLLDTISKFELIKINSSKMKQAAADMDSAMKRVNSQLPPYYYSKSHKEIILLALDEIKTTIKSADITVTNFDDKTGGIILPVNISTTVTDYTQLVNNIGYLQSLNFPYFAIKNILIEKMLEKSVIICKIDGSLRMPAERLKDRKKE